MAISPSRNAAFGALFACAKQGAWSDRALKKACAPLDAQDAALAAAICYGVVQNRLLLDFWIGTYCSVPLKKLEPCVRLALEMGLYQLAFLDRIPDHAAVSESVDLAKRYARNPNSARLVNGVLRTCARNRGALPQPEDPDPLRRLSVRYSHPLWLVQEFARRLDENELEELLRLNNTPCPTVIQTNTLRTTTDTLERSLSQAGAEVQAHPWLPDCLILRGAGALESLDAFQQGLFWVQDAAARLAVLAAAPERGARVLDACAAPGGKSFAAAQSVGESGTILSCDIHAHKIALIEAGARRLGIQCIRARQQDARAFAPEWENAFDLVLADVPCSGLGIIRKKPDIREKPPEPLKRLPEVQRAILENVCRYVRPGGQLLYATCTLIQRENEDVVHAFLSGHPEFQAEPFTLPGPAGRAEDGMCTLWPQRHGTDGFFIAKLRKKHE